MFTPGCAPAPPAEPVKIGAIFAVTGPASFLGAPEEKTAQMLVEKINAAGGVNGRKLELVVKDSGGSPEKAVSFAKQLIEEEKVLAIIGPSTSGETMQIKALCEENKVPLVSCAAAETIVNPVAKYVFKTPQKDSQAVTWIYRTMKDKGITKIAILSSNDGFGAAGKKQLEDLAKTEGIAILANEVYDKQATDLTDILTKVKGNSSVQAVVNWSIVPAQSIVAKNMKQLGLDVPLFQSHGFGNLKYVQQAGVAAEGILFPAGRLLVVDDLPDSHPQKKVLAAYKKDYESALQGRRQHVRRARLRRADGGGRGAQEGGHAGPREGARRHREPQGLRRHGRRVQLLAHRPHRPRSGRLRDADGQGRQVHPL